MKLRLQPTLAAWAVATLALAGASSAQAASVCFYEHVDYQGASFCADADNAWVGGAWNDRISSVRVPAGTRVTLFNDSNYGGASLQLTGDANNLVGRGFNDNASSFRISTDKAAAQADVWVTYPDRSRLISWDGKRDFDGNGNVDGSSITVDENQQFQVMDGFGASLTDSSSWLIMNRMNEGQRNALMQSLFGFNDGNAGISYLRIPLGGSDFSLNHYSFDDSCCDLNGFSINHDRAATIPLAVKAKSIDNNLKFMATPWSPPAWMKTSGALGNGKLRQDMYPIYATFLRRVYDDYRAAGVTFDAMTIQNEPLLEPGSYPGAKFEWWDELNFVRDHLAPRMSGTGLKLVTFDHNWDLEWYPKAVMNEGRNIYDGSAWHCYAGSNDAMSRMHDEYPDKNIYFTECTGIFKYSNFGDNMKWNMQNLFIGGVRNWAKTVLLWNLALDPNGGPHTGGCGDCRGVVTIDQGNGSVRFNEEFYSIAHFARFIWPGARRIASSNSGDGRFISAAFKNTNGGKAMVVLNQSNSAATFRTVVGGRSVSVNLPASGVATVVW